MKLAPQFLLRLNPAWVIIRSEIFGMKSRSGGQGMKEEVVSVTRLDQFHIPNVDLVKIDVEGAELRVLKERLICLIVSRLLFVLNFMKIRI